MALDSGMEKDRHVTAADVEKLVRENGKLKTEIASLQIDSQTGWLEKEIEKLNSKKEGLFQAYENVSKVEKQLIMDITRVEVQIETCQGELSRLTTAEEV